MEGLTRRAKVISPKSVGSDTRTPVLDAFNIKNVRRVLSPKGRERSNNANEDAITSMVFTPLRFMSAEAAFDCLQLILPGLDRHLRGRVVASHKVELWPSGLTAPGWGDNAHTKVEPDLLARFSFTDGSALSVIGELKWDWEMKRSDLEAEVTRQRIGIERYRPGDEQFSFVLLKRPIPDRTASPWNCAIDWFGLHRTMSGYLRAGTHAGGPVWEWLTSVSAFLVLAERATFSGISGQYGPIPNIQGPIFYEAP